MVDTQINLSTNNGILVVSNGMYVTEGKDMEHGHRKIIYDRKSRLGSGAFGAVFKGTFNGNPVAVKRITLYDDKTLEGREENALKMLIHPNIVRLLHTEYDSYFK